MPHWVIAIIVVVVLVVIANLAQSSSQKQKFTKQEPEQNGISKYEAVPSLLTPAERSFFGVLQQAIASDYQVFAKVRLADIVRPVRNPSRSGWQTAFNRITGKHVDFILCDSARLAVLAVIELDDKTHERFERGVRDMLVDSALADARIPVLRITASQSYSPAQIREQIKNTIRVNS